MSRYTKDDIFRMVEEEDVEFIRLQFTDIFGTLKNIAILTKPSTEEPSNMHLLSSAFSSWLEVIAIFLSVPKISVN